MSNQKTSGGFSSLVASISIVISLIIGILVYVFIFGDSSNFVNGNNELEPLQGNFMGIIYKGGVIVPILLAVILTIIIFTVERFITLAKGKGRGNINNFVVKIKSLLEAGDIDTAIAECDKQRGSLANVVRAGLERYKDMQKDASLNKEQKLESIKKELEEATALELPMLSKNLVVLSTCASIATLIGLIGTVLGMIKSFAAMSQGSPDTAQLATGISTIAIIMFNLFSTKIDQMTYSMDEASFTIVQNFSATEN
jgi:biopolymer transport protein ExbB